MPFVCQVLSFKFLENQEISDYTDHKMITLIESTYRFNQGVESSFSEFFTEWKISDLGDRGKSSMDTLWR